jgi:uncharacterized Ntn-hydrolase superfamily protein
MRHIVAAFALVLATGAPAFATWSVMALDQKTGTIVIASATCETQRSFAGMRAKGLMDIQAIVAPGRGAAVAQGTFDGTRATQRLIYAELGKRTDPQAIEFILRQDPGIEVRQFSILDMEGRHTAFSASGNPAVSLHEQGQVPGTDIWYSIQGDMMASEDVAHAAVRALTEYRVELADRVMAAMEAADARGGDRRCSCASRPVPRVLCETRTAHVAYILRAEKNDSNKQSYNDGRYAMYLSVTDDDITSTENPNPVKTLRLRYEAWKRARPD